MKTFLVVLCIVGFAAAQIDNLNFIQRQKRVSRFQERHKEFVGQKGTQKIFHSTTHFAPIMKLKFSYFRIDPGHTDLELRVKRQELLSKRSPL